METCHKCGSNDTRPPAVITVATRMEERGKNQVWTCEECGHKFLVRE